MRKIVDVHKPPADPALHELLAQIDQGERKIYLRGLKGSAKSFVLAVLLERLRRTAIVLAPTEREADRLYRDLRFFSGEDRIFLHPAWDTRALDLFAVQREAELKRVQMLYQLTSGQACIVIVPMKALMQKVIPRSVFENYTRTVAIGDFLDRDTFIETLIAGGYARTTLVEQRGEFSARGHIIDVHPPIMDRPVRMELMGDELESIRQFDPASQRSSGEYVEFVLTPARELILAAERKQQAARNIRQRASDLDLPRAVRDRMIETIETGLVASINPLFLSLFYDSPAEGVELGGLGTLFDYIPPGALLILDDEMAIRQAQEGIENDIDRSVLKAGSEERFYLEKDWVYLSGESIRSSGEHYQQLLLEGLVLGLEEERSPASVHFSSELIEGIREQTAAGEEGLLRPLAGKITQWLVQGEHVSVLCGGHEECHRMIHLLQGYRLPARHRDIPLLKDVEKNESRGQLWIRDGRITAGFQLPAWKLVVISEEEIFGKRIPRRRIRPAREGYFLKSFGELNGGDFVVHKDHGIGIYGGLQKLSVSGLDNDFLVLEYQDTDKLYIPVDRLDQIQRYIGPDGYTPRLDRLGGSSWEAVKERVKKSIREVAEELVSIYAAREVLDRDTFSPPDRLYDEFCATFEFEETPDQVTAIEDIHLDMGQAKPMDRLICGDAGFGKTEVALRASFRAVMDGRQVAILVPTTVLAEQHCQTFTRRFRDYPVAVAVLDRLKSKAEQQRIAGELGRGTIDIAIGTHRLLQKDIAFKDLGLVIIDEEQRFGVAHKEKLKKLRTLVDVLTLTATPIPRTLHLSLVGIRDLSIINTPPEDRQPIKTYVLEFDEDIIRDAIRQEIARGGQVFFLHDRVRSIFTMARLVQRLVPEANVGVIHGRMKPKEIEEAMVRFIRQDDNVLVCTTIIGSGVDIPTANTIIINRADRFGLSQLYQLRGRVGRSREEGLAYLLVPKGAMLSPDAQKRLQVIMDFTEPGSGFRIASQDLEIRGAGNLLGISQSGHVSAVGYELYTELMEKTIREIKGEPMPEEEVRPEINLGLSAFIPEQYMTDEHRRLVTYKRISLARSEEELTEVREELADCYGFIPAEVDNLLEVIWIRNLLKLLRGKKMAYDGQQLFIQLNDQSPIDPAKIMALAHKGMKGMRLTPDYRLTVPLPDLQGHQILERAKAFLEILQR